MTIALASHVNSGRSTTVNSPSHGFAPPRGGGMLTVVASISMRTRRRRRVGFAPVRILSRSNELELLE